MKERTSNGNGPTLKILAIVGFLGIIIIIAWLSVQLVNILPGAFSSLASVADSVNKESSLETKEDKKDPLILTSNTSLINTGDDIVLSWSTIDKPGSYVFSYHCVEGVSLNIVDEENGIKSIDCERNYNIGDVGSLNLQAESAKARYENVNYTIDFLAINDTKPRAGGESSFTIINSQVQGLAVVDDNNETEEEAENSEEEFVENTPDNSEEVANTNSNSYPQTPIYEQEFVYEIPVSNPDGRTDLSTRFLGVGEIKGSRFIEGPVEQDESGAIQFEVKNLGSKTSEEWTFKVSLPTGGYYESEEQKPLKPNEAATITIGFNTGSDDKHTFKVEIEEETDRNSRNDQFTQPITFID